MAGNISCPRSLLRAVTRAISSSHAHQNEYYKDCSQTCQNYSSERNCKIALASVKANVYGVVFCDCQMKKSLISSRSKANFNECYVRFLPNVFRIGPSLCNGCLTREPERERVPVSSPKVSLPLPVFPAPARVKC